MILSLDFLCIWIWFRFKTSCTYEFYDMYDGLKNKLSHVLEYVVIR